MKYLIDSHILIWFIEQDHHLLKKEELDIFFSSQHTLYVSFVTFLELELKFQKGTFKLSYLEFIEYIKKNDFHILPITLDHIMEIGTLPNIHSDPFDRILIAQAKYEKMKIISHDSKVMQYV